MTQHHEERPDNAMTGTTPRNPWDALIPTYERWMEPCSAVLAKAALDQAAPSAGSAVLDVAAGTGALAVAAAERGHSVDAIDTSSAMVGRLTERLKPYSGCSAKVMDALDLRYGDDEFDAAFSILGVLDCGDQTTKALAEMVRVVRPGGVVSVAHWADPVGAPFFTPLGRAINRLNDPGLGKFVAPLSEYLKQSEIEHALSQAGCHDVRLESIQLQCVMPQPETFVDELHPIFRMHPQYLTAVSLHRNRFRTILAEEVRAMETGEHGHPIARANIASALVTHDASQAKPSIIEAPHDLTRRRGPARHG
ncbi:methyltransferase domain-containing protein [Streptomyces sp. HC44]|uniref:Methyltransferase domain-containing protein n=1 Tax=Streptomyces scabichelini TaxID=2711217 RepID=A0A6G4VFK5_9ACTN|nr:class I SAM-dependent methyltransferase [Streptomyces scabichelini]NGO12751.1 methyltransferase domain-containing protein [Streptomyces scabichelini]